MDSGRFWETAKHNCEIVEACQTNDVDSDVLVAAVS